MTSFSCDLIALVADTHAKLVIDEILNRYQSLGCRKFTFQVEVHAEHDAGVRKTCDKWLRRHLSSAAYAIACFDHDGCGLNITRTVIELQVEQLLATNGWQNRCACVVIEPELEIWFWSRSPVVAQVCDWTNGLDDLYGWLTNHNLLPQGSTKPFQPKETLQKVLRQTNVIFSGAIRQKLARQVSLAHCTDPAFLKLKSTLQAWFPQQSTTGLSP